MERHNNWSTYSYNGVEFGKKLTPNSTFSLDFKKVANPLLSYKDALYNNARIMRDSYNEPFDVFLSGGIDSEVVVRVFKELGITHNTIIFKLENNINIRDVNGAIEICKSLNIPYKIIDFNVKKFFENEAEDYFKKCLIASAPRLPRLKWLEMSDNIPIFGQGEPYWFREKQGDYNQKSNWFLKFAEDDYIQSVYAYQIEKTVIGEWYEFTPEVILATSNIPYVQHLLDDRIFGKQGSITSKAKINQTVWPDIKERPKLVGYEGFNGAPGEQPEFITEFTNNQKLLTDYSNSTIIYLTEDFKKIVVNDV